MEHTINVQLCVSKWTVVPHLNQRWITAIRSESIPSADEDDLDECHTLEFPGTSAV